MNRVPLSIAYRDLRELERLRARVEAVDPNDPAAGAMLLELEEKVEEIRSRRRGSLQAPSGSDDG